MSRDVPPASSAAARRRMERTRQRDTAAELALRRALFALGLRYYVDRRPLADVRRRADVLFPRTKVAVYVDGCFWHGCPLHATWPAENAEFWRDKIETNRRRDEDTNRRLAEAGWLVVRIWEHEDAGAAAGRIADAVRGRKKTPAGRGRPAGA